MTPTNLSISDAASMLLGAGLIQVTTNIKIALTLVGVGVAMKVLVAVLNHYSIPISAVPPEQLG